MSFFSCSLDMRVFGKNKMSGIENNDASDQDFDKKTQDHIVEKVLSLNKLQNLKKPSRTEPTLKISEFNLVKSISGKKGSIQLDSLTESLKSRKKYSEISNKLKATKKKSHPLPKPLEKPQAERILRSVGYEKSRFEFDRWEALVQSNRAAAHQVFPLGYQEKIKIGQNQSLKNPFTWKIKSDIQKELDKLDNNVQEYYIKDQKEENAFPLTLKELKEQRKEAAKLRAQKSFKEAKARRQNRIKSKKYHRILRKEKIRKKLKDFEELQKTDPEAALKKLNEIEKARALERFSLRHKGTGQWAHSKQVRAKYDKDSRQVLAQQLSISRELTHKFQNQNSDSEEENLESLNLNKGNSDGNPWVGRPKPKGELSEFVSGYKKFWAETLNEKVNLNNKKLSKASYKTLNESKYEEKKNQSVEQNKEVSKKRKVKENKDRVTIKLSKKKLAIKKLKKTNLSLNSSSGDWDINDLFKKAEIQLENKLKQKSKNSVERKKAQKSLKNKKCISKMLNKTSASGLSMPNQSKKHVINESMIEKLHDEEENINNAENILKLKNILKNPSLDLKNNAKASNFTDIIPAKFIKPKPVILDSANPDMIIENGRSEFNNQHKAIMEAFEDDAIDTEFSEEKKEELDTDTPQDIDLNLPGWGSWGGSMLNPAKQRKRKRFIIKMPKDIPRQDINKASLIINEKSNATVRSHLVSEMPFPFKTVQDFEASIRAPIGNTFVPETAFRKLIKPEIETKMGVIIDPMTKSVLMGK